MSSISRLAALILAPTAALLLVAAPATPASATTNSQAEALVKSAIAATKAATSFSLDGHGVSSGEKVTIDVTVSPKDAYGELKFGTETTDLRRVGKRLFAKGSKSYLEEQGASSKVAGEKANKWIEIKSSDTTDYSGIDQYLTAKGLLVDLVPSKSTGAITGVKTSTVGGQAVEAISGTFSGQKGILYVATHGKPYLLRVVQDSSKSDGGTITLSDYGKSVHTSVPSPIVSA